MLRRILLGLIAGLLLASPASALSLAVKQALGPPGWVLPYNPDLQFDFGRGTAWQGTGTGGGAAVPPESALAVTRASTCMIDDLGGQWVTRPANTLCRSDKGATPWEARTNLALWSRDLTNAAWVKVTMTTALTATGIDGTANAATTITATGAASTILQTVTQSSTADTVSFFVRRRTGTGTIEVTANNFTAATDITAALATAATATPGGWHRATVSATLVNPVLGLRITTSGDAVDVDFGQLEAGTYATSPILTTTVAVVRAADLIMSPLKASTAYTMLSAGVPSALAAGTSQIILSIDSGSVANFARISRLTTTGVFRAQITAASATQYTPNGAAWTQFVLGRGALVAQATGSEGFFNGVSTVAAGGITMPALSQITIGSVGGSVNYFNGYIKNAVVWGRAIPAGYAAFATGSSGP